MFNYIFYKNNKKRSKTKHPTTATHEELNILGYSEVLKLKSKNKLQKCLEKKYKKRDMNPPDDLYPIVKKWLEVAEKNYLFTRSTTAMWVSVVVAFAAIISAVGSLIAVLVKK